MTSRPAGGERSWANERPSRADLPRRSDTSRSRSVASRGSASRGRSRELIEQLHTQNCPDYGERQFCLKGTRCQRNHQYDKWQTLANHSRILDGIVGQNHTTWELMKHLGQRIDALDKKLDLLLGHYKISNAVGCNEDTTFIMSRKVAAHGNQVKARSRSSGPVPHANYYVPAMPGGTNTAPYNQFITSGFGSYNTAQPSPFISQPQPYQITPQEQLNPTGFPGSSQ